MTRLGVHKRWHHKFLLKEVACRVPERAGLDPARLADSLASHADDEQRIAAYADGDPTAHIGRAWMAMHWHGQLLLRRAEHDIYKHGYPDREAFHLAAWHQVLAALIVLGRNSAGIGRTPPWITNLRDVGETMSMAYALGWNTAADKIGLWAIDLMPHGCMWWDHAFDERVERDREPFARFVFDLYADFAQRTLPTMPAHPYEAPVYDALLACWRNPDPAVIVEPLLAACDWHTHECMYSRSDRPSKRVDFINDTLMGWPVEVHMVYRLRERLGQALPTELDHPLMKAPLGAYLPPQPVPQDERLNKVVRRACHDVPGLEALLAGAL